MDISTFLELFLATPSAWAAAILMAGILLAFLKITAPVVRELKDMIDSVGKVTSAQNDGWQSILDRQEKIQTRQEQFYQQNIKEVNGELIKLRQQYNEVSELLQARDKEIIELRKQVKALEDGDKAKTEKIAAQAVEIKALREELNQVKSERDTLSERMDELRREIEKKEKKDIAA
jgi:uncharacterized coiled-coil DUF342 family protein